MRTCHEKGISPCHAKMWKTVSAPTVQELWMGVTGKYDKTFKEDKTVLSTRSNMTHKFWARHTDSLAAHLL